MEKKVEKDIDLVGNDIDNYRRQDDKRINGGMKEYD